MKINVQLKGRMTHTDKGCQSQQKMLVSNKTGNATVFLPQHTPEIRQGEINSALSSVLICKRDMVESTNNTRTRCNREIIRMPLVYHGSI